tara:strand:- start:23 stop:727 length:705 start_codon:yes stop_codon:yes gene_type:complete
MKSLAIIVARGNSKRLPGKNLKEIGKHPLVYWACKAAKKSNISNVVVSTESKKIIRASEKAGVKKLFLRPRKLTKDFTLDLDIIFNALDNCEKILKKKFDVVCYMQPTTPFLRSTDINKCLKKLKNNKLSCVFTARPVKEHPRLMWKIKKKKFIPVLNGNINPKEQFFQKLEKNYIPDGGIWCMRVKDIKKQKTQYAKPIAAVIVKSQYAIDIDNFEDLFLARNYYRKYKIRPN